MDPEQLDTTLPPSTMTLGGMLKHMAYVEDWWFGVTCSAAPDAEPFDDVDWDADNDWDWHSASGAPEELRALFDRVVVATSDQVITAAAALDQVAERRRRRPMRRSACAGSWCT